MKSDTKFIALDRARSTLHLLKKSNIEGRDSLIRQLTDLQLALRYSSNEAFDPVIMMEPFLALLRAPYLAGPFKQAALDSIQILLTTDVLSEFPDQSGVVLTNIVDAITRCKFIQTDATGDELVQLNIIQTLNIVVKCSANRHLTGDATWDIVETCQNILLQAVAVGSIRSPALCSSAERTLLDTIRLVFTGSINFTTENDEFRSAEKILSHFISILDKYCSDTTATQRATIPRRASSRVNPPLDSTSFDSETTELCLALKAINVMILASRSTISTPNSILRSPAIFALIRDDLSRSIVMLSNRRDFLPIILQSILSLFGSLFSLYGPFLRVLVSCFVPSVYLKALHQLCNHFAKQYDTILRPMSSDYDPYSNPPSTPSVVPSTPGQPAPISSVNFNFDEMEMILESLGDLISDPGFLPTLFASFDCDPSSPNIVKQLLRYLCQSSRYSIVMEGQRVGTNSLQLYEHCVHLLRHVLRTLFTRFSDRVGTDGISNMQESSTELESEGADSHNQSTHPVVMSPLDMLSKSLRSLGGSKALLSEAAKRFIVKPQKGLQYLQDENALPRPLTPASVAKFLRIARDLPKDVVGSFLGELGKDDAQFEADGKDFHAQVLLHYVQSFSLENQGVMNCMRIFLSAFRLPGEAQQIDRILVAFSEFCHSKCLEGRSGLLENAEVTYLLTFSIIMLNTDRHNPNIKPERKMTLEQFIRNNSNYGSEVKQTKPLPRDFLESIYNSIAECPIRTENHDIIADITVEVWMDLQLQASEDISRSTLLSCCHSAEHINSIATYLAHHYGLVEDKSIANALLIDAYGHCNSQQAAYILLTTDQVFSALDLSAIVDGKCGFVDADLALSVWQDLLAVAVCPYLVDKNGQRHQSMAAAPSNGNGNGNSSLAAALAVEYGEEELSLLSGYIGIGAGQLGLQLSVDIFVVVAKIADSLQLHAVVDAMILMLGEFSALLKGGIVHQLLSALPNSLYFEKFGVVLTSLSNSSFKTSSGALSPVRSSPNLAHRQDSPVHSINRTSAFLEVVINSVSARVALSTLLRFVQHYHNCVGVHGWSIVWQSLSLLRDCVLLPKEMIVEAEQDVLPVAIRKEFDAHVKAVRDQQHKAEMDRSSGRGGSASDKKRSKSFLSLSTLSEAIFGSGSEEQQGPTREVHRIWRWDEGYEDLVLQVASSEQQLADTLQKLAVVANGDLSVSNKQLRASSGSTNIIDSNFLIPILAFHVFSNDVRNQQQASHEAIIEETFRNLRMLIFDTGISKIVTDSRYLSTESLYNCVTALAFGAENLLDLSVRSVLESQLLSKDAVRSRVVRAIGSNCSVIDALTYAPCKALEEKLPSTLKLLPTSECSCTWLEMLLVDIAMRNRDRFWLVWPVLDAHYRRTLTSTAVLSYVTERRVTGLFRVASRMLSRSSFSLPLLQLINVILSQSGDSASSDSAHSWIDVEAEVDNAVASSVATGNIGLTKRIVLELANQISGGLWHLLTQNVTGLPSLQLDQWQILFDLIAQVASVGDFASVKAFESMAWLLHEPRLRAEVPVFCIVALKPLMLTNNAPLSVSTGAIQLLSHLHTRLEVLIKDTDTASLADGTPNKVGSSDQLEESSSAVRVDDEDAPLIWEASWVPILQAFAEGSADSRIEVRCSAVEALGNAIVDKHCSAVPVGVLIRILGDVVVPVLQFLGEMLVQAARQEVANYPKRLQQQQQQSQQAQHQLQAPPKPVWKTTGTSNSLVAPMVPASAGGVPHRNKPSIVAPAAVVHPKIAFVEEAICSLCSAFVKNLSRLATYPSFDKLWFRFLHVFGYFLGASHGFEESLLSPQPGDTCNYRQMELIAAVALAKEKAQNLIDVLVRTKIFKRRPELWIVTVDIVSQFRFCPDLTDCSNNNSTSAASPVETPQVTEDSVASDSGSVDESAAVALQREEGSSVA